MFKSGDDSRNSDGLWSSLLRSQPWSSLLRHICLLLPAASGVPGDNKIYLDIQILRVFCAGPGAVPDPGLLGHVRDGGGVRPAGGHSVHPRAREHSVREGGQEEEGLQVMNNDMNMHADLICCYSFNSQFVLL